MKADDHGGDNIVNLIESAGWIALGFVPTFVALYLSYETVVKRSRNKHVSTAVADQPRTN